jgi:hypothetical protein
MGKKHIPICRLEKRRNFEFSPALLHSTHHYYFLYNPTIKHTMGGGLLWFFLGAGAAAMYRHKHADHNSDSQSGWGRCHAHFRAHNAGPHQALPPLNASAGQAPYSSSTNDSLPGPSHPAAPPTGPAVDPWAAEKERKRRNKLRERQNRMRKCLRKHPDIEKKCNL